MSKTFTPTNCIIILHFKLEPILTIEKIIGICVEEEQRSSLDGVCWFQTVNEIKTRSDQIIPGLDMMIATSSTDTCIFYLRSVQMFRLVDVLSVHGHLDIWVTTSNSICLG